MNREMDNILGNTGLHSCDVRIGDSRRALGKGER